MSISSLPIVASSANPTVKLLRSLQRRRGRQRERAFVLEGARAVGDAFAQGLSPRVLVVRADQTDECVPVVPPEVPVRVLNVQLFNDLAGTEHPQGILAVMPLPDLPRPTSSARLTLVADRVRDPGNLGTLVRSAAAGGVDEILIADDTVDPFNPKVVRAGMGAHLRVPIHHLDEDALADAMRRHDVVAVADAEGDEAYDRIDWTRSAAIVVGGEAEGVSWLSSQLATVTVRIPLDRGIESLNAGVAGSLLIFEAARQRRLAAANR